jgi:hypothetical protein
MADTLNEALFAIQNADVLLLKDAKNPHFKNTYATLGAVLDALKPHLKEQGLLVTQIPCEVDGRPGLKTTVTHLGTGVAVGAAAPLVLDKDNMQGYGSALTYMKRYALTSIFSLDADEDDDGNASSRVIGKVTESGKKTVF